MERRDFLKFAFGFAAVAGATVAAATSVVNAAPLVVPPTGLQPGGARAQSQAAEPAIATDTDLQNAPAEQVQWRRRRRFFYRRRFFVRRRRFFRRRFY